MNMASVDMALGQRLPAAWSACLRNQALVRTVRQALLICCLALACLLHCGPAVAQAAPYVGTYRADGVTGTLALRVLCDARVELLSPADGGRQVLAPVMVRTDRLMGYLPSGEVWSVGVSFNQLMMSQGTQLWNLSPLPAEQYAAVEQTLTQRVADTGGANGGSGLTGLTLLTAGSSSGISGYREYTFCSDGRYHFAGGSMGGGGGVEMRDDGQWRQSGDMVQLTSHRGGGKSMTVQRASEDIVVMDNVRYAAKPARDCR